MIKKLPMMIAVTGAALLAAGQAYGYTGPVTFANQDILVDFRSTTSPTTDLTFDLGNVNTFLSTYEGQGVVNLNSFIAGTAGATLTSQFGNLNNLVFSVVAENNDPTDPNNSSLWATRQSSATGNNQGSTAWTIKSQANQSTAAGKISTTGVSAFGSYGTAFGNNGAAVNSSATVSYLNQESANGNWGASIVFGNSPGDDVKTGSSFTTARGDFYAMVDPTDNFGTAGTYEGWFQLDSSGNFEFYSTPVPEPATYGVLAGLGSLIFALRNRFRKVNA